MPSAGFPPALLAFGGASDGRALDRTHTRYHRMSALAQKRPLETDTAVIVLGGSFCPLHAGHLAALEAGRTRAQALGLTVVAGYLACAHDSHVRAKLGAESTAAEERWLAGSMRLAMCNAASAAVDWLRPTPKPFGSARECAEAMVAAQHAPETHIIIVRGSDRGGVHARRPRKTKLPRVTHLDVYRHAGAT